MLTYRYVLILVRSLNYLEEVEQLDKTDRLSQKAESVSGLSVLFPFTEFDCFLEAAAVSDELVGLDLEVLEVTEATGDDCLVVVVGPLAGSTWVDDNTE